MWTKDWFFDLMHRYDCGELSTEQVWDYVDLHSSASNNGNAVLAAGWIPVAEKLPPEHEKVLVQFGDQNILIGIMDSNDQWAIFWSDGIKDADPDRPIDYWMPLPACR